MTNLLHHSFAIVAVGVFTQTGWTRPLRPPVGEPVTREFVETELREVIRFLAEAMGRNVYLGPGVEGRLTVSLRSVPPVAALHEVLRCFSPNLAYKQIGSRTLVVAEPELCEPPLALCNRPRPPKGSVRQEILLERAPAAKVITSLQENFPEVDFIPHPLLNGFYVVGRPSDLTTIRKRVCPFWTSLPSPSTTPRCGSLS